MPKIGVRPRGKYYEYRFAVASIGGKRKWIQRSGFKTQKEAHNAGAEALAEYINAGAPAKPCNMSYSDYLDKWIENYCKNNLAYNTIATYETLIRLYIKPGIGMYRLADIKTFTITKFLTELVEEHNFTRAYVKNIFKVVKGSFTYACSMGDLKYNPSLDALFPKKGYKGSKKEHNFSQEDIDKILKRFENNREFTCAFLTACYTGMRTGEVLALTWDDINFDEGFISVKHSVYDKPKDSLGRWYMKATKTENGIRTIPLCNTLKEALLNYKKYQDTTKHLYAGDYKKYGLRDVTIDEHGIEIGRIVDRKYSEIDLDFIFTRENGTYSGTDIIKAPNTIMKDLINPNCRFYDLRRTLATRLVHNEVVIKDVAAILGHASTKVTEDSYVDALREEMKKAMDMMGQMVSSDAIDEAIRFAT